MCPVVKPLGWLSIHLNTFYSAKRSNQGKVCHLTEAIATN
jgi:hypothetical protein